jgi:hypothetical protein
MMAFDLGLYGIEVDYSIAEAVIGSNKDVVPASRLFLG